MEQKQVAKPKIPSFLQKKQLQSQQKTKVSSKDDVNFELKLNTYYQYKIASLHNQLNRKNYFLQYFEKNKEFQTKYKNYIREKNKFSKYTKEQYIEKLLKDINQKSKYRHREKQDLKLALILKTINYDLKGLAQELQEKAKQLNLYADMEDDEQKEDYPVYEKKEEGYAKEQLKNFRIKNKVPNDQRVLIVKGGYPALIESLMGSGKWFFNEDLDSLAYDLKFTVKKRDIDFENASDSQLINRFKNNHALTSKHGVARNLPNLISKQNSNIHQVHPRCYDLIDATEIEDFIEEFKYTKAESVLKQFYIEQQTNDNFTEQKIILIQLCLDIINRKMQAVVEKIQQIMMDKYPIVSPKEWNFINNFENQEYFQNDENNKFYQELQQKYKETNTKQLCYNVLETLEKLKQWDPQYSINGKNNIWIVKPAGLSRGRGIKAFNDLEQLICYVLGKEVQWVAQKYIENPLTLKNHKFDIRQWVLVSDWDPLTIWFYDECYVRLCSQEYSNDSFQNPFAHLTNNCIQSKIENFEEQSSEIMMNIQDFQQNMIDTYKFDVYTEKIKPQLIKNSISTIQSVVDSITHRKGSFEIYGFDFMIDESFNVWMIEVNSSPTMEYSTTITEKIVPQFLRDVAKLINNYIVPTKLENKQIKNLQDIETGKLRCIYKEDQQ